MPYRLHILMMCHFCAGVLRPFHPKKRKKRRRMSLVERQGLMNAARQAAVEERQRRNAAARRASLRVSRDMAVSVARAAAMLSDVCANRRPSVYANDKVFERLAKPKVRTGRHARVVLGYWCIHTYAQTSKPADFQRFSGLIYMGNDPNQANAQAAPDSIVARRRAAAAAAAAAGNTREGAVLRAFELGDTIDLQAGEAPPHASTSKRTDPSKADGNSRDRRLSKGILYRSSRLGGGFDDQGMLSSSVNPADPRRNAYRNPERNIGTSTLGVKLGRHASPHPNVNFQVRHTQHFGTAKHGHAAEWGWATGSNLKQASPVRTFRYVDQAWLRKRVTRGTSDRLCTGKPRELPTFRCSDNPGHNRSRPGAPTVEGVIADPQASLAPQSSVCSAGARQEAEERLDAAWRTARLTHQPDLNR